MDTYVSYDSDRVSYVISASSVLENGHSWISTMMWLSVEQLDTLVRQIEQAQKERHCGTADMA